MKKIVIIGAGDFGKEVAWLIEEINDINPQYEILGYLDDAEGIIGKDVNGYKVLGPVSTLRKLVEKDEVFAVIAIQNGDRRLKIVNELPGYDGWETVMHPSVHVAKNSTIGKGCVVCAGTNISVNTSIGNHCIFNFSSTIGHDCLLGDYVSVMSGSCVCGHVQIKDNAYLATNCSILPGMRVGYHSKVGAGSVVLRNVKDEISVMGVPAKKVIL